MVFIKKYKLEEQAMLIQKYKTQIKDQNHLINDMKKKFKDSIP